MEEGLILRILLLVDFDKTILPAFRDAKDWSSSIDREQLRRIKYETTPEQRMNWLEEAGKFFVESRKNRENQKSKRS